MGINMSMLKVFFSQLIAKKEVRILMLGLDAAGKTTILYKLKLGDNVMTIPTIGFNVESVEYKNLSLTVWDIGGQERLRNLWRHYYPNTQVLIFIVDSSDQERVPTAKEELHRLMQEDELRDCSLLVYANKQDLPGAYSVSQLSEKLELHKFKNRKWYIQACSAVHGDGLHEGLEWVAANLN